MVIGKEPAQYPDLETFTRRQAEFIQVVQDSFAPVCKGLQHPPPVSEIRYLYDYIRQGSVANKADSVAEIQNDDFLMPIREDQSNYNTKETEKARESEKKPEIASFSLWAGKTTGCHEKLLGRGGRTT